MREAGWGWGWGGQPGGPWGHLRGDDHVLGVDRAPRCKHPKRTASCLRGGEGGLDGGDGTATDRKQTPEKRGDPVPPPQQPPRSHRPGAGGEEKGGARGERRPRGLGPVPCAWRPGARPLTPSPGAQEAAPSPPSRSPLAKHRLDGVVHLGVLVVLGGHQEFLNTPKHPHQSGHPREGLAALIL